jgi:hypothetical protein
LIPTTGGRSRSFAIPSPSADTADLSVPVTGTPAGDYLVRLRVDGADSPLEAEDDPNSPNYQRFIAPLVTI